MKKSTNSVHTKYKNYKLSFNFISTTIHDPIKKKVKNESTKFNVSFLSSKRTLCKYIWPRDLFFHENSTIPFFKISSPNSSNNMKD
jgi:hypothetical protein